MNVKYKNIPILAIFVCFPIFLTICLVLISNNELGRHFISGSAFELFAFSFVIFIPCLTYYLWKKNPELFRKHIVFVIVISLVTFSYLGFLREYHPKSWDFMSYYLAAKGMEEGINIYDPQTVTEFNKKFNYVKTTYLYTPLLATIIGFFSKIGESQFFILYEFGNFYALVFFLSLLYLVLLRYEIFSGNFISIFLLLIFIINVPIMRTLIYGQINFYTMDLILISILIFRKNDLMSATLLCLAANLKLSPFILIVAFFLQKDWRWLYYFCLAQLLIIIVISSVYGYKYWLWFLDFILQNTPPASFRNNSLDSLIWSISRMIGFNYLDRFEVRDLIVISAKLAALCWIGRVLVLGVKERIFYRTYDDKGVIYNSVPILIIGMMVASPYMWPHHFVFMILPFILLLSCCKYRSDFTFYIIGYLFIFVVPVFDIFPFSYHRIFGIFMFMLILDRWLKRESYGFSKFVVQVDKKMDELFCSNKEDN